MDYLQYINEHFPIRRSAEQKARFQKYILTEAEKYNKSAAVETIDKHSNIVMGDVASAKVIYTAHYDTPATSLLPNLMLPRNLLLCYLYHFSYPFALAMISLAVAKGIQVLLKLDDTVWAVLYIILYLGLFWLCTRTFVNKHNKNDNTSGVATVMSIMSEYDKNDVAFILFDDEEKGLLGSKAYNKKYMDIMTNKLVINLDCVGVGEHFITIANPDAEKLLEYEMLKKSVADNDVYKVLHCPKKGSMANSDHKNFKCGIGIVACKKNGFAGYYTSKIHTNKDTEAYTENVEFISKSLVDFTNAI